MTTTAPNQNDIALSIIIISYNAADYLRRCLQAVAVASPGLSLEIIVVDNLSKDNSCQVVEQEFPNVTLLRATSNLGFAAANNLALRQARGRYFLLLNSDCFVAPDALRRSIELMDATPQAGAAGPRLYFEDGSFQISARLFPTVLSEFFTLSGLSDKHPSSRFFSSSNRTWDSPDHPAPVGWVTGAYMLLRASLLEKIGLLDDGFYFYHEDVDICRRVHAAGFEVWYWPQIEAVHIGGGSAKKSEGELSTLGGQVVLWRTRSLLLYYRKHHGSKAALVLLLEMAWYWLRAQRNRFSKAAHAPDRYLRFQQTVRLLAQAWRDTHGGRTSPPRPW
jgi:hypothetical protein